PPSRWSVHGRSHGCCRARRLTSRAPCSPSTVRYPRGERMAIRRKRIVRGAVLRLLADPLKLRIAEALRDAPASPHELARRFGLKPTALYHHFARLAAAGLVEVAARRRRRGAVERLYRLTARQLVVDRRLVGTRTVSTVLAVASAILQVTGDDVHTGALDPSRPLADRQRSELATIVVRT